MGFKVGTKKPEGSGRKKGTPNRKTDEFFDLCKKHNHNPIEFNIMIAKNMWKEIGYETPTVTVFTKSGDSYEEDRIKIEHRITANNKLLDFMYPKVKALEITNKDEGPLTFNLNYNPADFKADEQG